MAPSPPIRVRTPQECRDGKPYIFLYAASRQSPLFEVKAFLLVLQCRPPPLSKIGVVMRLTLRTMLAYLDDILEPKDADELGKKIEQSETATNLIHRIRDVMRRLRLGAPNVTDRGAGLDPNTVAEYLDNTLPDARVPDFERVCLESDIHLAEVASCHQVLALVLGEPAEVDPASRQQMYELPEVLASKTTSKPTPPKLPKLAERPAGDGDHQEQVHPPRSKPPVPDYLRETARKRRLWRVVMGMVCLFTLVLAVLTATGQFKPGSGLEGLLGLSEGRGPIARTPEESDQSGTRPVLGEPKVSEKESPSTAPEPGPAAPTLQQPSAVLPEPTSIPQEPKATPPTVAAATVPAPLPGKSPAPVPAKPEEANPPREPHAESQPKAVPPHPLVAMPAGPAQPVPASTPTADSEPKKPPRQASDPAPVAVEQVAKYISPTGFLLKFDPDSAAWQRVSPNALLGSQDRILSLPAFRPVVLLVGDVRMEMIDGARVDLQPTEGQSVPVIRLDFGRVVLRSDAKEKGRIRIRIGERNGLLSFGDAESVVAIQVGRARIPGVDPEVQPLPRVAEIFVTTGRIAWQEGEANPPVTVAAPVRLTLNDKPIEAVAVQQFPMWISPETIVSLEQQAAVTLDRETEGRPTGLAIRELADHRKREVRWLAVRCLGYLGDFQPVVTALNDPEKKQDWQEYAERLREAVVRSPDTAAAIRSMMQRVYGNDGVSLYELLWKYPDDRLSPEDAAQLIRYLDNELLACRVLAFWGNLKRVTGLGLFYRPEDPAAKRQPSIAKWKERLKTSSSPLGGAPAREKAENGAAPPRSRPSAKEDRD